MVDIIGKRVRIKDGRECIISDQSAEKVYITIDGTKKAYQYKTAFLMGGLSAIDPVLQAEIIADITSSKENTKPVKYNPITTNDRIKSLMIQAIEYPRPKQIANCCRPIWNQPFFYKIDQARALTISYNPTDAGAQKNYQGDLLRYYNHNLSSEEIYELLYNFEKEIKWRKSYDLIFKELNVAESHIAHMDASIFPYNDFKNDYLPNKSLDDSYKFLQNTIELLGSQLEYIFIDGAENEDLLSRMNMNNNFHQMDERKIAINNSSPHKLKLYQHKNLPTKVIYYGCQLYGRTCPADEKVKELAQHIKTVFEKKNVPASAPSTEHRNLNNKTKFDAQTERNLFWDLFDKKLIENGMPFNILHNKSNGDVTHWATINKKNSIVNNCITLEFSVRLKLLRISIYIRNDLSLYSLLESHKSEIDSMVSVPLAWVNGSKNANTKRIQYEIPVQIGNPINYKKTIDEALPIIKEFINVCKKYGNREFFDF